MGIHYLCPTMPHKSDFVDLLDDVDETSKLFHSVNAIRLDENGSHGSGMDGKGAVKAMEEGGAKLNGINALLYGAGGISGVTAYELAQSGVKKLYIANRTPKRPRESPNWSTRTPPLRPRSSAPTLHRLTKLPKAANCSPT